MKKEWGIEVRGEEQGRTDGEICLRRWRRGDRRPLERFWTEPSRGNDRASGSREAEGGVGTGMDVGLSRKGGWIGGKADLKEGQAPKSKMPVQGRRGSCDEVALSGCGATRLDGSKYDSAGAWEVAPQCMRRCRPGARLGGPTKEPVRDGVRSRGYF